MSNQLSSMTGFARVSGEADWGNWVWEAKSVNGRGLDVRVNNPPGLDALERLVKSGASKRFKRGSIHVSLKIEPATGEANLSVNESALNALIVAHKKVNGGVSTPSGEALAGLMAIKGVVESGGVPTRQLADNPGAMEILTSGMNQVLNDLRSSRLEEGKSLSTVFLRLVKDMEASSALAITLADNQPKMLKARLEKQLAELQAADKVDADRLAAEIAINAAKADVREELDRLAAHLQTARTYLTEGSPIGRKLDFLSQELNREANTLCSKSIHLDLTKTGLALKSLIDQFKEQAANVE